MDALQQQLEELMSFRADTELQFEDGTVEANSTILSFFSSVLRGAVEAHTAAAAKGSETTKTRLVIPIDGVSREEWMQVKASRFWRLSLGQVPLLVVQANNAQTLPVDAIKRMSETPAATTGIVNRTTNAENVDDQCWHHGSTV